jgi:hypothetical protein
LFDQRDNNHDDASGEQLATPAVEDAQVPEIALSLIANVYRVVLDYQAFSIENVDECSARSLSTVSWAASPTFGSGLRYMSGNSTRDLLTNVCNY